MKINIKILSLVSVVGLGLLSSCNKNLDLNPVSTISDGNYWKTADQFDSFVSGLHARFRNHERAFVLLGEYQGEVFGNDPGTTSSFTGEAPQGVERMWNHNLDLDNPGVSNFGAFYENINQINLLISKLNTTDIVTAQNKGYYLGIAYGMRAFYYFQLYRSWGDAVLQTEPVGNIDITSLAKAASPASDVLGLVTSDLENSLNSFGTDYSVKHTKSYWSKAATLMLKAEVNLWNGHRGGGKDAALIAKNALSEIKSNLALSLQSDFSSLFAVTNRGNNEMIFVVRHQLNEATLGFISEFVPQSGLIANYYDSLSNRKFTVTAENYGGILRAPVRVRSYRDYADLDQRKNISIQAAYSKDATGKFNMAGCFLKKYQGEQNAGSRAFTNDFPIYRYADLLLLLAEAKVVLGESPKEEINLIRARAFGTHYNESTHGFPNQKIDSDPMEAILKERKLEFIGEGKYWYDLRRMGDSYVYKHTSLPITESFRLLWPINRDALTNNRLLVQTKGYTSF